MTDEERTQILEYRAQDLGYRKISKLMDIPESTIKSFCNREKQGREHFTCLQCGKALIQVKGRKKKKFCSDKCRMAWWNAHKSHLNKKTFHEYICPACGKSFKVYGNVSRKYCSTDCYLDDRFPRRRKAVQAVVEDNMPAETAIVPETINVPTEGLKQRKVAGYAGAATETIVVPETVNVPTEDVKRRKVAGYARVSTDMEEQQNSYSAQMSYFRNYITHHDDWEFVGMYSDEEHSYPALFRAAI